MAAAADGVAAGVGGAAVGPATTPAINLVNHQATSPMDRPAEHAAASIQAPMLSGEQLRKVNLQR